jgi:hypothetical protein
MIPHLLPEEDVLDEPDDDDEADPTLPGDLWFRLRLPAVTEAGAHRRAAEHVVYSRAFVPMPA